MDITRRRNLTAAIPSPLLRNSNRFEDLGTFDEEECRFFLREVGERVVPVYPFSFGMEEVYSLILERYGYAGLPDATSVLQDLLESDGTAAGFGDDGDVWRSWRHSWRHRNADTLNPFIPKVGSFVLQPPTLPHVRKIKALNFIQKTEEHERRHQARKAEAADKRRALYEISPNQNRVSSAPVESNIKHQGSDDENSYRLPATTYSHPKTRTLLPSGCDTTSSRQAVARRPGTARDPDIAQRPSKVSSQQEFTEVDPFLLDADLDPSLLITSEMLSNEADVDGPTLRGGNGETIVLQQVSSHESPTSNKQNTLPGSSPLPRIKSSPFRIFSSGTPSPPSRAKPAPHIHSGRVISEPLHAFSREEKLGSAEREKSAERPRKLSDSLRPFARRPAGDNSERSKRIRADNRQVRILDGVILNPKARQRLSSPPTAAAEDESRIDEKKKSVVRRSLTPVWQKRDSSRSSWIEIMRNFFRTEASSSQAAKQLKRESYNLSQPVATPPVAPPSSDASNQNKTHTAAREQPSYSLGLDGTLDIPTFAPNTFISAPETLISNMLRSRLDQRPLPPDPPAIVRTLSAQPGFPPSHQLHKNNQVGFHESTTSARGSHILQAVTEYDFARKGLLETHQFQPVDHEHEDRASHPAVNPTKTANPRISQLTYSSEANANPWTSHQNTPNPAIQTQSPFRVGTSSYEPWDPFASNSSSPNPIPPKELFPQSQSVTRLSTQKPASSLNPQACAFAPIRNLVHKYASSRDKNASPSTGGSPNKNGTCQRGPGRYGVFLKDPSMAQAPTNAEKFEERMPQTAQVSVPEPKVSFPPSSQAAILGELESILTTAVNEFLADNARANRLRPETVTQLAADWETQGRLPVVGFLYDCRTQRALVLSNCHTVNFDSDLVANPLQVQMTMNAWESLVSVFVARVLCLPDYVIHLHVAALRGVLNLVLARDKHHVTLDRLQKKVGRGGRVLRRRY